MMAFLEFRRQGCDYVVLECGIGGKLDATNIVDSPECSVITSIGHDHMDVIGNSLDEIATEKAGVIKPNRACVLGPTATRQPVYQRASFTGSQIIPIENMATYNDLNNAIATQVLKIIYERANLQVSQAELSQGLDDINQPCRFERVANGASDAHVIMDVCHNFQGINSVLERIKHELPHVNNISVLFAISRKKALDDVLQLFESDRRITDLHVISRPHFKLLPTEEA